jgi:hypothetical protein
MTTPARDNKRKLSANTPGSTEPERARSRLTIDMEPNMENIESLEDQYTCNDFEDIAKCFATLHTKVLGRVKRNEDEIRALKVRAADIEANNEGMEKEVSKLIEHEIPDIVKRLKETEDYLTKQDLHQRKWNVIVKGLPGMINEDAQTTEKKGQGVTG